MGSSVPGDQEHRCAALRRSGERSASTQGTLRGGPASRWTGGGVQAAKAWNRQVRGGWGLPGMMPVLSEMGWSSVRPPEASHVFLWVLAIIAQGPYSTDEQLPSFPSSVLCFPFNPTQVFLPQVLQTPVTFRHSC